MFGGGAVGDGTGRGNLWFVRSLLLYKLCKGKKKKKYLDCRKILSPFPFYLSLAIFLFLSLYQMYRLSVLNEDSTFVFWVCLA